MTKNQINTSLLPPVTTPEGMTALRQILLDFDRRLNRIEYIMYGLGVMLLAVGTKEFVVAFLAKWAANLAKGA
jgi:hypothetical protein